MTRRPRTATDMARTQIEAFRRYAIRQGHSKNTADLRTGVLYNLAAATGKNPHDLDRDDALTYLATPGWSQNTRATYRRALDSWWRHLVDEGIAVHSELDGVRRPRSPRGRPRPVTTGEALELIGDATGDLLAFLLLAAYEGLRAAEIASLRGEDLRGGLLHVVGKGGAEWWLPVATEVHRIARDRPRVGWWFPSRRAAGGHVVPGTVTNRVTAHLRAHGIVDGSTHRLRHWFGTQVQRGQGDIMVTKELMRHASVATTQIYTEVAAEQLVAAVESLPHVVGPRLVS
jgi:integrase/recombinase XerD